MEPLISVIVPVYKVEKSLRRCIDSLIGQTYRQLQIILVDDGSPDRCGDICDIYSHKDKRVTAIHQRNCGLSAARNTGIQHAQGQYYAFVDSDDYVAPDFISFLYTLMCEHDADIASCGVVNVEISGKQTVVDKDRSVHVMDSREALERMCYNDGFYVTTWDKLYKAQLFEGIRFPEGKLFEDTGTTYKLVDKASKIVACCEPKYYYMISPDSITTSAFTMAKLDYVEMADNMAAYIMEKYPDLRAAAQRKQMHACFSTLCQLTNSSYRNKEVERNLTARIRALRPSAMADPRTPKRDRAAIFCLMFGYHFFSFAWQVYFRVKKG